MLSNIPAIIHDDACLFKTKFLIFLSLTIISDNYKIIDLIEILKAPKTGVFEIFASFKRRKICQTN